jgi:hypothetical protein
MAAINEVADRIPEIGAWLVALGQLVVTEYNQRARSHRTRGCGNPRAGPRRCSRRCRSSRHRRQQHSPGSDLSGRAGREDAGHSVGVRHGGAIEDSANLKSQD